MVFVRRKQKSFSDFLSCFFKHFSEKTQILNIASSLGVARWLDAKVEATLTNSCWNRITTIGKLRKSRRSSVAFKRAKNRIHEQKGRVDVVVRRSRVVHSFVSQFVMTSATERLNFVDEIFKSHVAPT